MQMYYSIVIYKLRKCVNMHVHWTDTDRTLHGHCTDVRVRSTDMRVHDTDVHAHCTDTRVHCTDMHVHARRQISTILYVSCLIHRVYHGFGRAVGYLAGYPRSRVGHVTSLIHAVTNGVPDWALYGRHNITRAHGRQNAARVLRPARNALALASI